MAIGNHELVSPKREQTIWSSSLIGLIHQRFAPKDFATIPAIIGSELIITGFKEG
jgi:hypothetical protein